MASIWAAVLNFLASVFRASLAYLTAFKLGQSKGKSDARAEQARWDYDAVARAADARERASDDADGMRSDPFNRDNARS